jgi:hypothetical protein
VNHGDVLGETDHEDALRDADYQNAHGRTTDRMGKEVGRSRSRERTAFSCASANERSEELARPV